MLRKSSPHHNTSYMQTRCQLIIPGRRGNDDVAASAVSDVATIKTLRIKYAIAVTTILVTSWQYLRRKYRHVLSAEVKTGCSVSDISADHANTVRIFVRAFSVVRIGIFSSPNEIDH